MRQLMVIFKKFEFRILNLFENVSQIGLLGKFLLSYWPSTKSRVRHEYITVTPDGFRYRQIVHNSTGNLFKYFKDHYSEMPPAPKPKDTGKDMRANLEKIIGSLDKTQLNRLKGTDGSPPRMGGETPYSPAGNDSAYGAKKGLVFY